MLEFLELYSWNKYPVGLQ